MKNVVEFQLKILHNQRKKSHIFRFMQKIRFVTGEKVKKTTQKLGNVSFNILSQHSENILWQKGFKFHALV